MNLARKVQKLFTAEAIESLFDHAKRWSHPVDEQKILRGIDRKAWDDLRARYPQRPDAPRINRFSDVDHWLKINIERAQDLWLDRSPPLRILDLGCGPGYFLYVCKQLGHEGVGVDIDEQPLFRETTALLGVRRVIFRIEPQTPLPDLGEKFDLVTGHRVCFQKTVRWGTVRASGTNGNRTIGNFFSTMSGKMFCNQTAAFFSTSIHAPMGVHFSRRSCSMF